MQLEQLNDEVIREAFLDASIPEGILTDAELEILQHRAIARKAEQEYLRQIIYFLYGTDKGNTKANMAFIRSERNAFGRLSPDALPPGIEVIDEDYTDVPDIGKVDQATGEIVEGEASVIGKTEVEDIVKPQSEPPESKPRGFAVETKGNLPTTSKEKSEKGEPEPIDWYTESLKKIKWSETTIKSYLGNKYQVDKSGSLFDVIGRLNQEEEAEFVREIKDRLEML